MVATLSLKQPLFAEHGDNSENEAYEWAPKAEHPKRVPDGQLANVIVIHEIAAKVLVSGWWAMTSWHPWHWNYGSASVTKSDLQLQKTKDQNCFHVSNSHKVFDMSQSYPINERWFWDIYKVFGMSQSYPINERWFWDIYDIKIVDSVKHKCHVLLVSLSINVLQSLALFQHKIILLCFHNSFIKLYPVQINFHVSMCCIEQNSHESISYKVEVTM